MAKLLRVGFAMKQDPKPYRLLKGCAVDGDPHALWMLSLGYCLIGVLILLFEFE